MFFLRVLYEPSSTFHVIREKKPILGPLLLVAVATVSVQLTYFLKVDFDHFVQESVKEIESFVAFNNPDRLIGVLHEIGPIGFMVSSAVSSLLVLSFIVAVTTIYFRITSYFFETGLKVGNWMSFVACSFLPKILSSLGAIVAILFSDGRILLEETNPISLRHVVAGDLSFVGKAIADSVDLTLFWSLMICVVGYREWLGVSLLRSVMIVALPVLLTFISLFSILA